MQRRTAYSEPGAGVEAGVDLMLSVEIPNAVERSAVQLDSEAGQIRSSTVGDPLPARLVDRYGTWLDDNHGQTGQRGTDRRRRPGGTATGDEEIDHLIKAEFRAASSDRIRIASSGMFSTVKTTAVSQAVWTSGSAMPSATTAT